MEHLLLAKVVQRILPMACFACTVYTLVLVLEIVGFYDMEATHPLLLISYPTVLHLFALPLLAFSLFGFHRFLFLFLCLNGFWIVAVIVLIVLIYFFFPRKVTEEWKKDAAHHSLFICYFFTTVALQILVHLLSMQCRELERRVKLKQKQLENERNEKKLRKHHIKDRKGDVEENREQEANVANESQATDDHRNEPKAETDALTV